MFNLVSILWIFGKKSWLLLSSLSCEMYVPKVLIGSMETFISRSLVLLFFSEPIHRTRVFLLFTFKPEISPNFLNTNILSCKKLRGVLPYKRSVISELTQFSFNIRNFKILTYFLCQNFQAQDSEDILALRLLIPENKQSCCICH